jgi:hypothetical protein
MGGDVTSLMDNALGRQRGSAASSNCVGEAATSRYSLKVVPTPIEDSTVIMPADGARDTMDHRKAETGSLPAFAGGEEGLKYERAA